MTVLSFKNNNAEYFKEEITNSIEKIIASKDPNDFGFCAALSSQLAAHLADQALLGQNEDARRRAAMHILSISDDFDRLHKQLLQFRKHIH